MRRWTQRLQKTVRAIAMAIVVLACTGCPLMIASSAGSAAYEGYKYEHKKKPAATASSTTSKKSTTTASSSQTTESTTTAPKKISDSDIE
jgi:hypothetical protein